LGGLFINQSLLQSCNTFTRELPQFAARVTRKVVETAESRHSLGKNEAARHKVRELGRIIVGQSTRQDRLKGSRQVVSRLTGALVRMILVMMLVVMPSVLLVGVTTDTKQMVSLVALFLGLLTFVEYNATYPSLVEFRDAPPFNRMRYLMLFATIFFLSMIARGAAIPSSLTQFADAIGSLIGNAMDFPYSPVRLATLMIANDATADQIAALRTAAGMSYLISLISLSIFLILLKAGRWPRHDQPFNVWINLPTFDPSAGGDVVARLTRDARINIALGFLLPFLTPAVVKIGSAGLEPLVLTSPQTLIWTMTAWAFLPASLFMRGIAMGRVADMIRETRAAHRLAEDGKRFAAA
jgi:hypothetical protein